jgi:hypothetical protein
MESNNQPKGHEFASCMGLLVAALKPNQWHWDTRWKLWDSVSCGWDHCDILSTAVGSALSNSKTWGWSFPPTNPWCIIKPAQLKAIPSSLRGNCSSFEFLIQCNRIKCRVITGEALPLPLHLGPAILSFKILSNGGHGAAVSAVPVQLLL